MVCVYGPWILDGDWLTPSATTPSHSQLVMKSPTRASLRETGILDIWRWQCGAAAGSSWLAAPLQRSSNKRDPVY